MSADDVRDDSARSRRERLRSLLGLGPPSSQGHGALLRGAGPAASGIPEPVTLVTGEGEGIPAFLLRPPPERDLGAAVVLSAGHGRGIDALVAEPNGEEYNAGTARRLAAAGFTVLCPEVRSFGRRRTPRPPGAAPYEPGESSCGVDAAWHLMRGMPLMGRRVADAAAAAAALRALPGVDPARVGVAGGSGGGAISLLLAAVEPRIAGALVANYFCTVEASLCAIRHCPCNIIPGLLPEFEMDDVAALVAPRPLVLEAGEEDPLFPIAATREAFARLQASWEGVHPPQLVVTEARHSFRAERSVDLLVAALA